MIAQMRATGRTSVRAGACRSRDAASVSAWSVPARAAWEACRAREVWAAVHGDRADRVIRPVLYRSWERYAFVATRFKDKTVGAGWAPICEVLVTGLRRTAPSFPPTSDEVGLPPVLPR